jgi:hypothetical protein
MFSLLINAGSSYLKPGASSSIPGLDHDGMHLTDPFQLLAALYHAPFSPYHRRVAKSVGGVVMILWRNERLHLSPKAYRSRLWAELFLRAVIRTAAHQKRANARSRWQRSLRSPILA